MRILIDVNHPAHVHLFRCAAGEWGSKGHEVCWVARDKDIVVDRLVSSIVNGLFFREREQSSVCWHGAIFWTKGTG